MTRIISGAFAVLALITSAVAGNAADLNSAARHSTVSYEGLNLASPAGAQILLYRLSSASKQVCGGAPDLRDLDTRGRFTACYGHAMSGAVAQVNSPLVTQRYAELRGKPSQETAVQVALQTPENGPIFESK